jgi:hypothetical protein
VCQFCRSSGGGSVVILPLPPLVDDEPLGQLRLGVLVRLVADGTGIPWRAALTATRTINPRPVRVGLAD